MLPTDESFLNDLAPAVIDGPINLREKVMLLTALRFFFGPAQGWGSVRDVSEPTSLDKLDSGFREPGGRYSQLEQQTSLPDGYFSRDRLVDGSVALFVAKQDNPSLSPSYFLYEPSRNLTLYVGPDLLHNLPGHLVINAIQLNDQYRPLASFTLRF